MKILGREPSAILGLVAVIVQFVSAFGLKVDADTQTAVNAVAAAAIGLILAFQVGDGVIAALTGFAQAGIALGMNLGLGWSADKQAAAMALVTVLAHFWLVRDRVTAPVPASAVKRPVNPVS
ncbi:hypothetical protein ACFYXD_35010 [Streptomyces platensis]|uniref:hypothetical protein n=1 Tax=Streptomyces platensis TaxID=58346 RepID=UPI0036A3296E